MKRFKRCGRFFVYIVRCRDGTYYTGFTPVLKRRLARHNAGRGAKYTRDRRPVRLVWHRRYAYFKSAFLEEKRIKRLTRAEKDALVRGCLVRKPRRGKRGPVARSGCSGLRKRKR